MAEDETTSASAETDPAPAAPRSPAAAAASRARRIGGRTAPAARKPAPRAEPVTTAEEPVTGPSAGTEPVTSLRKPAPAEPTVAFPPPPPAQPAVIVRVPGWLRWTPAAVLIAAALTMAVLLATFSHSVWWAKPGTSRASANAIRDRVLAAAKSCTVAANAYSYQTFDVDETKGEQCLTGVQVSRYKSAMAAIKSDVLKVKASQVPQINDAGIESITANGKQWGIVVYGQLSITQTGTGSTPRIDPFAAYVRMDYVHGKWLMSSLCTIGGTGQC